MRYLVIRIDKFVMSEHRSENKLQFCGKSTKQTRKEKWVKEKKNPNLRNESQFHGYVHSFSIFCIVWNSVIHYYLSDVVTAKRPLAIVLRHPICLFSGDLLVSPIEKKKRKIFEQRTYPLTWAMIERTVSANNFLGVVGQSMECDRRRCIQNSNWTKSIRFSANGRYLFSIRIFRLVFFSRLTLSTAPFYSTKLIRFLLLLFFIRRLSLPLTFFLFFCCSSCSEKRPDSYMCDNNINSNFIES